MFNTEPMEFIGVDENGFATYRETTKEPENMANNTENDVIHREILKRATETFDAEATTWRECWNATIEAIHGEFVKNEQMNSAAHTLKFVDKEPAHPYEKLNWVEIKPLPKPLSVDYLEVQFGSLEKYSGDQPKLGDIMAYNDEKYTLTENQETKKFEWVPVDDTCPDCGKQGTMTPGEDDGCICGY